MASLDRLQAQSSSPSACRVYPYRETACAFGIHADAGLVEAINQLVQTNVLARFHLKPNKLTAEAAEDAEKTKSLYPPSFSVSSAFSAVKKFGSIFNGSSGPSTLVALCHRDTSAQRR